MSESVSSIVIAIPTFRRPQSLGRLLDAIAALQTQAAVSVIVADNDAEAHAGFDLAQSRAPDFCFPLRAVIAAERGIAQVRNILIAEALAGKPDFIAMIDDDEWPDAAWIDRFLEAAARTGAGVLQGSIFFDNPAQPDIVRPSGRIEMLQGAGNLLIRCDALKELDLPWFDPQFALSGGEDRDFFVRLARAGVSFAWCNEARAYGEVQETRARLSWTLARAYSIGNSDMRVLLKHAPGPGRIMSELGKILAALLLTGPMALILAADPKRRRLPLEKLLRAAGKLSAMAGLHHEEYAVIHGK